MDHQTPLVSPVRGDVRYVENTSNRRRFVSPRRGTNERIAKSPTTGDRDHPDRVTDQLLVQGEKFKAKIEAPKGKQ